MSGIRALSQLGQSSDCLRDWLAAAGSVGPIGGIAGLVAFPDGKLPLYNKRSLSSDAGTRGEDKLMQTRVEWHRERYGGMEEMWVTGRTDVDGRSYCQLLPMSFFSSDVRE